MWLLNILYYTKELGVSGVFVVVVFLIAIVWKNKEWSNGIFSQISDVEKENCLNGQLQKNEILECY